MKKKLLQQLIGIGIFASLAVPALADFRTFTSSDGGKTIEAKIVSATANDVTIEMKNGQVVTSPLSKFSEADREFIAKWLETAPPSAVKWNFACTPGRVQVEKKRKDTKSHEVTEEWWAYDLPLENRSTSPAVDLEIRYRIYVKSEHEEEKNKKEYYIGHGILKADKIEPRGRAKLRTITVPVYKSSLKAGYEYKDGRRNRFSDELAGIWLKVFNKDGDLLWETKTPGKATSEYFFSNEDALKIGTEAEKE